MNQKKLSGRYAAGIAVVAFFLFYYVLGVVITNIASGVIEAERHNVAGVALQIGSYHFSALRASIKLNHVKIFPAGKETDDQLLASADEMYVKLSLFSLLHKELYINEVLLVDPKITYIAEGNDTSNWTGVKPIHAKVQVDDVKIKNGDVVYEDRRQGMHMELQDVNVTVEDIRPARHDGQLPTSIDFSAAIANTSSKIHVTGDASLFGEGISFDVKGKMTSAPVGIFAPYYAGQVPFPVVGGSVSVAIKGTATNGQFKSTNHVVLTGLRLGGGLEGALVNKFILAHSGPIVFNVTVSGDLNTGNFSIATGLSKNIAAELVARAAGNAPVTIIKDVGHVGKDVTKPIEKGGKSIERGLKRLFH
ncbi:MAG: hypothetical protein COV45_03320 [Deltaproteobacteria bacterium CG11_big_fil_rev_8_21_14_0_20_47_16]|nr:MAG: hypothetical protein COV45_03320 [Deltaproteobacteria bacterium CG11_big_fil_rev_8_21_14_0_20_47_16]